MATATTKEGVMEWVEEQLARDARLREAVEARLAEFRLEQQLAQLREARGLSQRQVARLVGVSQPAIARLEAGPTRDVKLTTLLRVVTALGGRVTSRSRSRPGTSWGPTQGGDARLPRKSGRRTMALNTQEILKLLEQNAPAIRRYSVRRLGLFGSGARGAARDGGDLDFVVEFETKSFDAYMDLKAFLERLFGCRVDLVLRDTIKPRLRETILKEALHAPGL